MRLTDFSSHDARLLRTAVVGPVTAAAYLVSAEFGFSLAFATKQVSAVWPPTGIAVVALLVFGVRIWPGIFVGALLANLMASGALLTSAGIAVGNTVAPIATWLLLRRLRFNHRLESVRDVLLLVMAALTTMTLSASNGVVNLLLAGQIALGALGSVWWTWWAGDALGVMVVAPLLLAWAAPRAARERRCRPFELALVLVALFGLCWLAFWGGFLPPGSRLEYAVFPLVIWVALRFGKREVSWAILVISAAAIIGATNDRGPFAEGEMDQRLILLDIFIAVTTVTAMALAAITAERSAAEEALQAAHDELDGRVKHRTAELAGANQALIKLNDDLKVATTALERTSLEHQHERERLAEAQGIAHVGSWEWDIAANRITWSDELYRIYGLQPSMPNPSYEGYLDRIHPDDRTLVEKVVQTCFREGHPFDYQPRIVRPNGATRSLRARGRVLCGADGTPIRMVGTAQDITEQRQLSDSLRQHANELARSNEELERFAYAASHDLRSPLRAVSSLAHWIAQDSENRLTPESRGHLALLQARSRRMDRLLRDLLDFSRIGRTEVPPESVNLPHLLSEIADGMHRPFGFVVSTATSIETLRTCRLPLQRVLMNLVDNAIKHHDRDRGRIRITADEDGDRIRFSVSDDGPGIPAVHRHKVFQMFQTLKPRDEVEGSGMGLAMVKKIVEWTGETVTIDEGQLRGATIRFTWPKQWNEQDRMATPLETVIPAIGRQTAHGS